MMHLRLALCFLIVPLVACGGGNSAAPTPQIPNVVGNYSGNTTVVLPETAQQIVCPTTTSVTQSGSTVNIAPIVLSGDCGGLSIPVGQQTIDNTGNIQGATTETLTDDCGVYNITGSGGFFGRELRISMIATSTTCPNINMTINLSR